LLSLGDFRAPTFSLSVTRDDGGVEDEFELFMQLLGTYFNFVTARVGCAALRVLNIGGAACTARPIRCENAVATTKRIVLNDT
jgi:hypothetical protein